MHRYEHLDTPAGLLWRRQREGDRKLEEKERRDQEITVANKRRMEVLREISNVAGVANEHLYPVSGGRGGGEGGD